MSLSRLTPLKRTGFARKPDIEPKPARGPRKRKCAVCKQPFQPRSMTHKACGPECAEWLSAKVSAEKKAKQQRQERAETKAKLLSMKPRKWWVAKTKKAMHLYVRTRDEGQPCCSCDTILVKAGSIGGDYDAGHLRSVALAKHLEFDPRNVWGQCKSCNGELKRGNIYEYERRLRIKIGDEIVDSLMSDNTERHLKIHDLQEIEAYYKLKLKELQP